jgi:hypothetical protein
MKLIKIKKHLKIDKIIIEEVLFNLFHLEMILLNGNFKIF